MNKFAERLKELRLEEQLTQITLAEKTGLSQSSIAKWESGKRTPTLECQIILAKFFNVSLDYLAGLSDEY